MLVSSEFPPGPGGIGHHAYQVARHLCQKGWQVVVLTSQDYAAPEEIAAFNRRQDFTIVRFKKIHGPPVEALYRLVVLHRWVQRQRPAVILASGTRAVWLAAGFTRLFPLPWLAVGHGYEFGTKQRLDQHLNRLAYSQADCVINVSAYTQSRMHQLGVRPKQEVVIHNGADNELFRVMPTEHITSFRRQLGLLDKKVLLTVGNVTERKGQEVVIRALPLIQQAVPEVHYLIVGLPTLRAQLSQLAEDLGVAGRVHFLGPVDQRTLVQAYNACDIYVMTSRHAQSGDFEGFGIAAVEAALCGKPAVVTQGSGLEEAILPGHTGLTVPENDPAATAKAITFLLQDDACRQQFGHQAKERALREQTWASAVQKYDQVLKTVIEQRQSRN